MINVSTEIRKDISYYKNIYQVSNYGRIKRLIGFGCKKERILKLTQDKNKYLKVELCANNIQKTHKVHRLVLETFVGSCPKGMICRHLDNNTQNNRLENLEWSTFKINQFDRISNNTVSKGSKHGLAKLNEWKVRIIKRLLEDGYLTQREIAKIFNVHFATISCIRLNKTWGYI